jgi:hypothetical protein
MSFVYGQAALAHAKNQLGNLETIDLRVMLLMTNTTAVAARKTAVFVDDITTLDEFDGAGYTAGVGGIAIANTVLTYDADNDRIELTMDESEWDPLSAGTRDIAGALVIKFVTDYTDSPVVKWFDDGGFPKAPNGGPFKITWSAQGALQIPVPLS